MNNPSPARYQESVVAGGLIIINSSLVESIVGRNDVKVVSIKGNDEAANVKALPKNAELARAHKYYRKE